MKKATRTLILLLLVTGSLFITSCMEEKKTLPYSTGTPYEVIVVSTKSLWEDTLGRRVKELLTQDVPMLINSEPIFTVFQIETSNFSAVFKKHRTILEIRIDTSYQTAKILTHSDFYAKPQSVFYAVAPTRQALLEYLQVNGDKLISALTEVQKTHYGEILKRTVSKTIQAELKKNLGVSLTIPLAYNIRKKKENFMWISNEPALVSQGITVYSYPLEKKSDLSMNSFLIKRNEFLNEEIPGPSKGSFMTTAIEFEPTIERMKNSKGRTFWKISGYWDVEGDFMGGPFVNYTTIDTLNNRLVVVDCYLYSPKKPKRNYLRELETIATTLDIVKSKE